MPSSTNQSRMLSDKQMLERMQNGWKAGQPFTVCGNGSTLESTANIRRWLPVLISRKGWTKVVNAGAGDLKWWKAMPWISTFNAYHYDLIPRADGVIKADITKDELPECDVIICRMVLNHLVNVNKAGERNEKRIEMALENFKKSTDYLIATHFVGGGIQREAQFARLDLEQYLGEPMEMVEDGHEPNCRLALWKI